MSPQHDPTEFPAPTYQEATEGWQRCQAREAALVGVLREIAKGEGRFSPDHLTHCINTVEDMKAHAVAALTDTSPIAAALLAQAEALRELCRGHNARGSDGPCDCVGCRALSREYKDGD